MGRIVDRAVRVRVDRRGQPTAFTFRGRTHRVREVLERWEEVGEWWEEPVERTVYRVVTSDGGMFELELRRPEVRWYLYRAYD